MIATTRRTFVIITYVIMAVIPVGFRIVAKNLAMCVVSRMTILDILFFPNSIILIHPYGYQNGKIVILFQDNTLRLTIFKSKILRRYGLFI